MYHQTASTPTTHQELLPLQPSTSAMYSDKQGSSGSETIQTTIVELSEKSRAIAHPGDKWKPGYLTLSRKAQNKNGWRTVHISKKSFEKLVENFSGLDEALREKSIRYQLMLTRKQHVLTTVFQRDERDPLYYVSIMHPVQERDVLTGQEEVIHAKTINLSEDEYQKLKDSQDLLLHVVRTRNSTSESDESAMLDGYRWLSRKNGQLSNKIFTNEKDCCDDARRHNIHDQGAMYNAQSMDCEDEPLYEYIPVQVQRPSKLELIEHVAYLMIIECLDSKFNIQYDDYPSSDDVDKALAMFDNATLCGISKRLLLRLKYKQLYLCKDLCKFSYLLMG